MNPSILVGIFKAHFPKPFEFSDHAVQRIGSRFSILDREKLNLMLQSFKRTIKDQDLPDSFVIAEDNYAISFVLQKDESKGVFILKTAIHGKLSEKYEDRTVFLCNIKKEKAILEAEMINAQRRDRKRDVRV